jgi:hypothetical protein
MRDKYLGTGRPGFRPLEKIRTALRGLRYAVLPDLAVSDELVRTVSVLASSVYDRRWLNLSEILLTMTLSPRHSWWSRNGSTPPSRRSTTSCGPRKIRASGA